MTRLIGSPVAWLVPGVDSDMVLSDSGGNEARERGFEVQPLIPASDLSTLTRERDALRAVLEKIASGFAGCDDFQDAQVIATEAIASLPPDTGRGT